MLALVVLKVVGVNGLVYITGRETVAAECMYSRSLQDVTRSIVRVEGVRR